jgi:uncharacterized protein (TIGR00730 family)
VSFGQWASAVSNQQSTITDSFQSTVDRYRASAEHRIPILIAHSSKLKAERPNDWTFQNFYRYLPDQYSIMSIQSIAVFCGSRDGNNELFKKHAAELGRLIAVLDLKLVYGGARKGIMGILADAVLANGGKVMGVIPKVLMEWEHQHEGLTELAIVPDMHTRKKMMYDMSDAAIIMPGGFGTLDEFFEMLTWNQLKIHDKKIYLLNSGGFYNHLYQHLKQTEKEGFLYEPLEERIILCENPVEVFNKI